MHQFKGLVQIEDGANNATILLDGDTGDVTIGGNGQDGMLVAFGATPKHCAFYLMSGSTVEDYADDLKGYATSKGTIRFQPDKPLPAALVRKLVKARVAENAARAKPNRA